MRGRGIRKGLKSEIPADLQQWNTTTAGSQVVALMVSGTESHLRLSLLDCRWLWFQRAVGIEQKKIVLLVESTLCSLLAARYLPSHPDFTYT